MPAAADIPIRSLRLAAVVLACAVSAGSLPAQTNFPLKIEIEQSSHVSRTCGPVRLDLKFTWGGAGILDGQLLFELRDPMGEQLGVFRIDDLYLTPGEQRQEVMLPGFRIHGQNQTLALLPVILDDEGDRLATLPLLDLRIPGAEQRSLVVAVFRPEFALGRRAESDLIDAMKLENLAPDYETGRPWAPVITRSVSLPAEDAPQEPLRYCTYDVVLLPGDGLATLSEHQLGALLSWIDAGGALFVLVDDASLKGHHADFLNQLAGADKDAPQFLLDTERRLIYGAAEVPSVPLTYRRGLGRAVVIGWNPDLTDFDAAHWPLTTAFLWKLRHDHVNSVAATGLWDRQVTLDNVRRLFQQGGYNNYGDIEEAARMQASDLTPVPITGGTGLLTHLMPQGMKVVPIWMIGSILIAYVLLIGPADYLILGRLGLRRWTWVTFPFITFGFTAFSVLISNRYMQTVDHRSGVIVRDVVDAGRIARESRFDLLFPSTSRHIDTDVGRGLFMPLRHQDFGQVQYWMYGPYGYNMWQEQRSGPASFSGRMPNRCIVGQAVPQWTPQLNRLFTIPLMAAAAEPAGSFDWNDVPAFGTPGAEAAIVQRVQQTFGSGASVYLYHEREAKALRGDQLLFRDAQSGWNQIYVNGQYIQHQSDFLRELCVRDQTGFFGIVSQYAPTGGDRLEDMAMLDLSDPRQWLLVVAVPEDDSLVIYRRLYVLND